ncbi:hypothetical protein RND81_04G109800 [Saponaria officinalis]|uniref:CCHC-type domain-containing protein n=1 Tax=Saponaria officinalis TaxID=3572 RepID=A0AAW1LK04_SAPOF
MSDADDNSVHNDDSVHDDVVHNEKTSKSYDMFDDPLFLSTSDQPMLQLVDKTYHQWIRCDLMVMKWIFNSVTKEIKDTLVYAGNSKDLWTEILDSKLKRTWENIDSIDPIPLCTCSAIDVCTCHLLKRIVNRESQSRVIQFLMGLSSSFDSVKTNVLTMEPLPPLNKAFALLQKIERQKQISDAVEVLAEANAFSCAQTSEAQQSGLKKQKTTVTGDVSVKTCNYCHHIGHTKDECFKLKECTYCGRKGHAKENCFRMKSYSQTRFSRGRGRVPNLQMTSPGGSDSRMVSGLVDTVLQKVLQALSDKSTSSLCTSDFAGPFK